MSRANLRLVETEPLPRVLHIRTIYYDHTGKNVLKKTASSIPLNAVAAAVKNLRRNVYKANIVEVIDQRTGKLHSVLRANVEGQVRILFEHKHERKGE